MGASSAKEFGERHRIYEKSAGRDAKREQSVRCLGNWLRLSYIGQSELQTEPRGLASRQG